jgi:hypothetical protein
MILALNSSYRASFVYLSRMIEPLELETDAYTGMVKLRSVCYLRNTGGPSSWIGSSIQSPWIPT